jgi:hypothetical protein
MFFKKYVDNMYGTCRAGQSYYARAIKKDKDESWKQEIMDRVLQVNT